MERLFAAAEGPLSEMALDGCLRQRLRRPHTQTGPFLRSLLSVEPGFVSAGSRLWTCSAACEESARCGS